MKARLPKGMGGGPQNMNQIIRQAQKMQDDMKALQEELGILPEETMVFGDQMNDMEMLEQAYYSFAVANARQDVKEAARFMADSNVNQGPMKIMKLLLNE